MYASMPPMSADYKGPVADEEDEETSAFDPDAADTSEEEESEEDESEEAGLIPHGKHPRVISDSDESDDATVAVQGDANAPTSAAPLRAPPPAPKRPKTDFSYALDLSS